MSMVSVYQYYSNIKFNDNIVDKVFPTVAAGGIPTVARGTPTVSEGTLTVFKSTPTVAGDTPTVARDIPTVSESIELSQSNCKIQLLLLLIYCIFYSIY